MRVYKVKVYTYMPWEDSEIGYMPITNWSVATFSTKKKNCEKYERNMEICLFFKTDAGINKAR